MTTTTGNYIRSYLKPWYKYTKKICNNKCVVTGKDYGIDISDKKSKYFKFRA